MEILRYAVFAIFAYASIVAIGAWLIDTGRLATRGRLATLHQAISDPVLRPIEGWLVRRGGNPRRAPRWLLGGTVAGGILVISVVDWLGIQFFTLRAAGRSGPLGVIRVIVYYAGQAVIWSILIRVVASWFGIGRYNRYMKPFYLLTDWIIEPLRKVIPPFGMIDISPIVAWFGLQILLGWIMSIL